ncbi:MAG: hypothetical protein HOB02_07180 [Proteobacteria bacterium]|nr:hypothetical protein [Pseudomonadota bacterium]
MRVIFTLFLLIGALTQGQAAHHETDEGADVFQANCAYCHNKIYLVCRHEISF